MRRKLERGEYPRNSKEFLRKDFFGEGGDMGAKKVFVVLMALAVAGVCLVGIAGCGKTEPERVIEQEGQAAKMVARQANLQAIDGAVQAYFMDNNTYPTDISQVAKYLKGGVIPSDPLGGTYYLMMEGGVPKAAVR